MSSDHHLLPHFEVPRLRSLAGHALPQLVEATLVPLGLFYLCMFEWGKVAAILAALGWSWAAILRRVAQRRGVPGMLIIGTLGLTVRSVIALATGSFFVYFLQPSLATAAVGAAFLFSIPAGRPLAERLAADFVPFPPGYLKRPVMRRVFVRITAIWALVMLCNAVGGVILLISQPWAVYLAAKTGTSMGATVLGVGASAWLFFRTVRRNSVPAQVAAAG